MRDRIHYFKIDERKNNPCKRGVYYYMRRFLTIYKKDGSELFSGHLETNIVKPEAKFGCKFQVGNAGSETPFQGYIQLFGSGIYWGVSCGRKLAQRITTSEESKYDGRELGFFIMEGSIYFQIWTAQDRWKHGEFAQWRAASFSLDPRDYIWGQESANFEQIGKTVLLDIDMPEASYPVEVILEKVTWGRPKAKRKDVSYSLDVNAKKGIPDRVDHSGGYKGDRVYGFNVPIKDIVNDWENDAKQLITASILKSRGENHFRKADPEDD